MTCPTCGEANPEGARFCNHCGTPMAVPAPSPPSAPVLPSAFANGRYQVKRLLGEGGKKKAYLVHDTVLDREVAFSLIKTEGLDEVGVERVRREARVMGRLGGHPHVVSVYDMGEEGGQPYLVGELMGGGDIEALIEDAMIRALALCWRTANDSDGVGATAMHPIDARRRTESR
jgi:Protein kinase domain/zinc-ribbon domain